MQKQLLGKLLRLQKPTRIRKNDVWSSPFYISVVLLALIAFLLLSYQPTLMFLNQHNISILPQIIYLCVLHLYLNLPDTCFNMPLTINEISFNFHLARVLSDYHAFKLWVFIFVNIAAQALMLYFSPQILLVPSTLYIILAVNTVLQYMSMGVHISRKGLINVSKNQISQAEIDVYKAQYKKRGQNSAIIRFFNDEKRQISCSLASTNSLPEDYERTSTHSPL